MPSEEISVTLKLFKDDALLHMFTHEGFRTELHAPEKPIKELKIRTDEAAKKINNDNFSTYDEMIKAFYLFKISISPSEQKIIAEEKQRDEAFENLITLLKQQNPDLIYPAFFKETTSRYHQLISKDLAKAVAHSLDMVTICFNHSKFIEVSPKMDYIRHSENGFEYFLRYWNDYAFDRDLRSRSFIDLVIGPQFIDALKVAMANLLLVGVINPDFNENFNTILSFLIEEGGAFKKIARRYFEMLDILRSFPSPPDMIEKFRSMLNEIRTKTKKGFYTFKSETAEVLKLTIGEVSKNDLSELATTMTFKDLLSVLARYFSIISERLKPNEEHKLHFEKLKDKPLFDLIRAIDEQLRHKSYFENIFIDLINKIPEIITKMIETSINVNESMQSENYPKEEVFKIVKINDHLREFLYIFFKENIFGFQNNTNEYIKNKFLEFLDIKFRSEKNTLHLQEISGCIKSLKSKKNYLYIEAIRDSLNQITDQNINEKIISIVLKNLDNNGKKYINDVLDCFFIDDEALYNDLHKLFDTEHEDYKEFNTFISSKKINHLNSELSTLKNHNNRKMSKNIIFELFYSHRSQFENKLKDILKKDEKTLKEKLTSAIKKSHVLDFKARTTALKKLFNNNAFLFLVCVTYLEDILKDQKKSSKFWKNIQFIVQEAITVMPSKASELIAPPSSKDEKRKKSLGTDFPLLMSTSDMRNHFEEVTASGLISPATNPSRAKFAEIYEDMILNLLGELECTMPAEIDASKLIKMLTRFSCATTPYILCRILKTFPLPNVSENDFVSLVHLLFLSGNPSSPNNNTSFLLKKNEKDDKGKKYSKNTNKIEISDPHDTFKIVLLKYIKSLGNILKKKGNISFIQHKNCDNTLYPWLKENLLNGLLFISNYEITQLYFKINESEWFQIEISDPALLNILRTKNAKLCEENVRKYYAQSLMHVIVGLLIFAVNKDDSELYAHIKEIISEYENDSELNQLIKKTTLIKNETSKNISILEVIAQYMVNESKYLNPMGEVRALYNKEFHTNDPDSPIRTITRSSTSSSHSTSSSQTSLPIMGESDTPPYSLQKSHSGTKLSSNKPSISPHSSSSAYQPRPSSVPDLLPLIKKQRRDSLDSLEGRSTQKDKQKVAEDEFQPELQLELSSNLAQKRSPETNIFPLFKVQIANKGIGKREVEEEIDVEVRTSPSTSSQNTL